MILSFFTFVFVMVVTAILFGSWVVVSIVRMIWRMIFGGPRRMLPGNTGRQCMNPGCRSVNPTHAHFCRRCGSDLTEPAPMRRMAQPQPRFNPNNGSGRQVARI